MPDPNETTQPDTPAAKSETTKPDADAKSDPTAPTQPPPGKAAGKNSKLGVAKAPSKANMLAEQIARDAEERRSGKIEEPALQPSELEEDWEEVQTAARPQAPAELAGLYAVRHGTLYFHGGKIVPAGRKVRLDAENAKMFLEQGLVRRLGD